jgi:hypothetical protein
VSWFQSIIFYTVSCILCALFSSSKRTVDARITLFSILSLNIVAERMLVQYYDKITFQSPDDKVILQIFLMNFSYTKKDKCQILSLQVHLLSTTWLYRKIALTLCVVTLFCTYYYYKDGQLENYKALQRIEQQLDVIQQTVVISNIEPIRTYLTLTIQCDKRHLTNMNIYFRVQSLFHL